MAKSVHLTAVVFKAHRALAWVCAAALVLWAGSGLLHTAITQFGVQPKVFAPPQLTVQLPKQWRVQDLFQSAGIESVASVQTVNTLLGSLVQVSEPGRSERRYINPFTQQELMGFDNEYAQFLARHYLQLPPYTTLHSELVETFSSDYPAVNRVLPVYKVSVLGANYEGLHTYVDTYTGALMLVSNDTKRMGQWLFQTLHTWHGLPTQAEWVRVALIGLLMLCVLGLALSGLVLLIRVRRRHTLPLSKRLHRWSAHVVVIPVLAFSSTGLWHLLDHAAESNAPRMQHGPSLQVRALANSPSVEWAQWTKSLQATGLSWVVGNGNEPWVRLQLKPSFTPSGVPILPGDIRNARFDGLNPNGPALYVSAHTGQALDQGDRDYALQLASRWREGSTDEPTSIRLIQRFGADYDFRNKRLPVWRVEYAGPHSEVLFIDTRQGVLVDRLTAAQVRERLAFQWAHKWSFLSPLGRPVQNGVVAAAAALIVLGTVMSGVALLRKRPLHKVKAGG